MWFEDRNITHNFHCSLFTFIRELSLAEGHLKYEASLKKPLLNWYNKHHWGGRNERSMQGLIMNQIKLLVEVINIVIPSQECQTPWGEISQCRVLPHFWPAGWQGKSHPQMMSLGLEVSQNCLQCDVITWWYITSGSLGIDSLAFGQTMILRPKIL